MFWKNPTRVHLLIVLILSVGLTVAAWYYLMNRRQQWQFWLASWLLAVNLVTFAWYGFDKLLATRVLLVWWRVPENVLHTLSTLGGSPAALLAMWIFRHKTIKRSFRILFWCIVVLQVVLAAYIVKTLWRD